MKTYKIIKNHKKFIISIFSFGLISFGNVFAGGIDHFDINLDPNKANIGEAVDLTIKALDKNDVIVEDYDGVILILSESDPEIELPNDIKNNTYEFKASDQGEIKFENAVIFKNSGLQDIYVYDLDDDTIMGLGDIEINKVETTIQNIDIEIVSPETQTTIGEDFINISGLSNKNHNIEIYINGKNEFKTTTNEEGIFEYKVTGLKDGENIIKANIIDADGKIIGESNEIKIEVSSNKPDLKNLKVIPEEVEIENSYKIEIITNNITTQANVIINEEIVALDKDEEGKFSKFIYAPSTDSNYSIDIILKDELGHEVKKLGVGNIKVVKPELPVAKDTIELGSGTIEPTIIAKTDKDLSIRGIKIIELKTKSVITWDKVEGAIGYKIYKKIDDIEKDNNYELLGEVTNEKFEIEFDSDKIKYDMITIRAIVRDEELVIYNGDLSEATKIKTGPELLILLLISLFIGGLYFFSKSKKEI